MPRPSVPLMPLSLSMRRRSGAHLVRGSTFRGTERRERDSNPRTSCPVSGFQGRCIQPLCHPSAVHSGASPASFYAMRRAISVLLIAVVAAFTLAACGGSDDPTPPTKAEYKQEYTALIKELATVSVAVRTAVNGSAGKSNKQLEKSFADVSDKTQAVADKFERLTPPDDSVIQAAHEKLTRGLSGFADNLAAISTAAGKNDLKAAGAAAAKLRAADEAVGRPKAALDSALGIKPPTQTTATTTTKKK